VRASIVIDEKLLAQAQKLSGCAGVRETVEAGLKLLICLKGQARIRNARGKLRWHGDLDRVRRD
jgi:Arc/MetJ family transcription regulator